MFLTHYTLLYIYALATRYATMKYIATSPAVAAMNATMPTFFAYQPSGMRSIFISASPVTLPMQKMLPPTADAYAIIFQKAPF